MQPFERLRAIARWADDDEADLVVEAASCLAAFGDDPAGLVVACRRLLAHHAASGALWWLCARVLCAGDPTDAAWQAARRVREDPTAARLAASLPFPHDEPVAALGWPETIATALDQRTDLDVVVVPRAQGDAHLRARLQRVAVSVRVVDALEGLGPTHVLVEAAAVGAQRALVPAGAKELLTRACDQRAEAWLVASVGRALPERLFDALVRTLSDDSAHELLPLGVVTRIAGPTGLDAPDAIARRTDCPVAPELLRLRG